MQNFCQIFLQGVSVDEASYLRDSSDSARNKLHEPANPVRSQRPSIHSENIFDSKVAPELAQFLDCLEEGPVMGCQ